MRGKGAAIQGTLAALGLVGAYATWQKEPTRAPGEVVVLDARRSERPKIRYEDGAKWVEIEEREGSTAEGPNIWLKVSGKPETKTPERELRGNDAAAKLLDRFTPLRAARSLGNLDKTKEKEFGLESPKKKIDVTLRGEHNVFWIGSSPFGVSDPYVRSEKDGKVYVFSSGLISDLDSAAMRLAERQLHGFKPSEYDGITVTASDKKRELVQLNPENPTQAKIASRAHPDKVDEQAKNWLEKLSRVYPLDVLGKDEQPASGAPPIVLRVDYTWRGKPRGFIEIAKVGGHPAEPPPAASSAPPAPATPTEYYARTEHLGGWVKLGPTTEDVLREADKVTAAPGE